MGARTTPARIAGGAAAAVLSIGALAGTASATYPAAHNGRLAFALSSQPGASPRIVSVEPDGSGLQTLVGGRSFKACPSYSADGTRIAYCRTARSGAFEIFSVRADGTHDRQLTRLGGFATFPDWSPDASHVAFGGKEGGFRDHIYTVAGDGTGLQALTAGSGGNDDYPVYSPDGTRIAFISDRTGVAQVWVMNADGSDQHALTTDPAHKDQLPDWSPDGTRIAYESDGTGNGDLYVMNADGSDQTRLTSDPAVDLGPAWSPDGSQIAFLQIPDDPSRQWVYTIPSGGGQAHVVFPHGQQRVPAWQPLR